MILNSNYFAIYDFILVLISFFILLHAFQKGFLRQLLDLVATILSFAGAWWFYDDLSQAYPLVHVYRLIDDPLNNLLWFVLLIIGIRIFLRLFIYLFHASRPKRKMNALSFMNHVAGLGIGFVQVGCIFFLWTAFCQLPFIENGDTYVQHSVVIHTVNQWKEEVSDHVNNLQ